MIPTNIKWKKKSQKKNNINPKTYTGFQGDYQTKAFGYEFNLNDDSSSLLYITTVNDPIVCYSYKCTDEGSADALAREEAVLNLLHNVFGLRDYAGQIAPRDAGNFPWQSSLDLNILDLCINIPV